MIKRCQKALSVVSHAPSSLIGTNVLSNGGKLAKQIAWVKLSRMIGTRKLENTVSNLATYVVSKEKKKSYLDLIVYYIHFFAIQSCHVFKVFFFCAYLVLYIQLSSIKDCAKRYLIYNKHWIG